MRQRRPSNFKAYSDKSAHKFQPLLTSTDVLSSSSSSRIIFVSGICGFVSCTLLLLLLSLSELPLHNSTPSKIGRLNASQNHDASNTVIVVNQDLQESAFSSWEWLKYYGSTNYTSKHLIAQISSQKRFVDDSGEIQQDELAALNITSRVNRFYAYHWHYDYVKITLQNIDQRTTDVRNNQSTTPKINQSSTMHTSAIECTIGSKHYIAILRHIFNQRVNGTSFPHYDYVWVFTDPAAMLVNFEMPVFDHENFLLAGFTHESPALINEEILLWNLRHPDFSKLIQSWEKWIYLEPALLNLKNSSRFWKTIPDDTSMIFHFPFSGVKAGHDGEIGDDSNEHDVKSRQQEQSATNLIKPVQHKKHVNMSSEHNQMGILLQKKTHADKFQTKDLAYLQSVADLVCFRYFPSCDLL